MYSAGVDGKAEQVAHDAGCDEVEVQVAATLADYRAAFRIAYEVYHGLGYTGFSPAGLRVSPHQLQPTALVLLARRGDEPVATLTVYADGPDGLPSDAARGRELGRMRAEDRCLFECGTLMVRRNVLAGIPGTRVCLELMRFAWLYVRSSPGACFCALVQKKHALFYERLLGYRRIGPPRRYAECGLNIPDVVPLFLDLSWAENDYRERFRKFGPGPRNLYRFFCEEGPRVAAPVLLDGLRRRRALDFAELGRRFGLRRERGRKAAASGLLRTA